MSFNYNSLLENLAWCGDDLSSIKVKHFADAMIDFSDAIDGLGPPLSGVKAAFR